jgi:hypothetical protein
LNTFQSKLFGHQSFLIGIIILSDVPPLLSKAEREYLIGNRKFNQDYNYTIKSRLLKKIQQFTSEELPLLIKNGYLTEFCKVSSGDLTENCKVSNNSSFLVELEGASKAPSHTTPSAIQPSGNNPYDPPVAVA